MDDEHEGMIADTWRAMMSAETGQAKRGQKQHQAYSQGCARGETASAEASRLQKEIKDPGASLMIRDRIVFGSFRPKSSSTGNLLILLVYRQIVNWASSGTGPQTDLLD